MIITGLGGLHRPQCEMVNMTLYGHDHHWFGGIASSPMCVMLIQKNNPRFCELKKNKKKPTNVTVMVQMNDHNQV